MTSFDHQGSDSFTLSNCSGEINHLNVTDTKETTSGQYATILLQGCNNLVVFNPTIYGGKDIPLVMLDCDDTHIQHGIGAGTDENRPFAWWMSGCKSSTFDQCKLFKYNFGFNIIGSEYKSGERFMTSRPMKETLGMQSIGCYVEDHTAHAFNINGALGARHTGGTAYKYTGTGGHVSLY